jgi:hypothetical protein
MNKPNNYDETTAYTDYTPLPVGGYVCKIMNVRETESKAGNPMIEIALDIAEGDNKGFYKDSYTANKNKQTKWPCIYYQLVEDNDGNTNRGLKTFHDLVTESNSGFALEWGDGYAAQFKEKLIGGIFGREQYENQQGEYKWSVKCVWFATVENIRSGKFKTPDDKYLEGGKPNQTSPQFKDDLPPWM